MEALSAMVPSVDADVEDAELRLAEALCEPGLEPSEFYALAAALPQHCWGCEWINPRPEGPLCACCLVPSIGGMGMLGGRLAGLGAEAIVSIGSGAGLVEWLLAARFDHVVCIDKFYRLTDDGAPITWVMPQMHAAVREDWRRRADRDEPDGGPKLGFVDPTEATTRLPLLLGGRTVAFLLCWPQLQPADIAAYVESVGGIDRVMGVVVVSGENCEPRDPAEAAAVAGCERLALVADGEEMHCLSEPCRAWTFACAKRPVPRSAVREAASSGSEVRLVELTA